MMKQLLLTICLIVGVRSNFNVKDLLNCTKVWTLTPDCLNLHVPICECTKLYVEKNKIPFLFNNRSPKVYVNDFELEKNGKQNRDSLEKITQQFNPKWDTKILTHGFWSNATTEAVQLIKKAYAQRGQINIFAIDWREYVSGYNYVIAANNTLEVGRAVAKLIDVLVEVRKADPQRIHLIGHSLGAHVMGIAGAHTRYRVGRITGLDPAKPCIEGLLKEEKRLDPSDAELVDVIHTCANFFGFTNTTGHADFYPNNGSYPQPGCASYGVVCSHSRSYEYYAESINSSRGFKATGCKDLKQVKSGSCKGQKVLMGDPMPTTARGVYYLKTSETAPFALG